jgi:hypothetical protein
MSDICNPTFKLQTWVRNIGEARNQVDKEEETMHLGNRRIIG